MLRVEIVRALHRRRRQHLVEVIFVSTDAPFALVRSNMVDQSSMRDIREASVYEDYNVPKLYIKQYYSIDAAVHQRLVRARRATERKNRAPPERLRRKPREEKKKE